MKTVVCDPEPFGFGPSADIFGVAKLLKKCKGVKVIVLASKQLEPIFRKEKGIEVKVMKYPEDIESFKGLVRSADVYITATNDTNLKIIRDSGINVPVVYIDSLFWYWGNYETPFTNCQRSADLYLACNYFNTASVVKKNKKHFCNIQLIPPIISERPKPRQKNQVLVNFGGLTSIFTTQEDAREYVDLMSKLFFHNLRLQEKFGRVIVSGNEYAMGKMAELNHARNMEFLSLDHDNFIKFLLESKFFLTNPGIHALYEGYANNIPTIGFFPSNHTQELQLKSISNLVNTKNLMDWSLVDKDFYKKLSNDPAKQAESIELIKGYVKLLKKDEALYDKLVHKLNKHFSNIDYFLGELKRKQKKYQKKVKLNGAMKVIYYMKKAKLL